MASGSIITWRIGRSADSEIHLNSATVSRRHAELTRGSDGSYYLIDCGSTHGSYVWDDGRWQDASHCFVKPGTWMRFGKQEISLEELVSKAPNSNAASVSYDGGDRTVLDSRPAGPVVRNPQTGEIEPR